MVRMSRTKEGEEEPILQWQDGVGNIPIWREEESAPPLNTSYRSVGHSSVICVIWSRVT